MLRGWHLNRGLLATTQRAHDARVIASESATIHSGNADRFRRIAAAIEKSESPEIEIGELEIDLEMLVEARTRFQRLYAAQPMDKVVQEALRVINEGGRGRIAKTDPRLTPDDGLSVFRGLGVRLAITVAFLFLGLAARCAK